MLIADPIFIYDFGSEKSYLRNMAKETVYNRRGAPASEYSGALIGRLIHHPVYGIGLVTSHTVYPTESCGRPGGSVYTVMWSGHDTVDRVDRAVIADSHVLDTGPPLGS
jgi:hypothetical protein